MGNVVSTAKLFRVSKFSLPRSSTDYYPSKAGALASFRFHTANPNWAYIQLEMLNETRGTWEQLNEFGNKYYYRKTKDV